MNTRLYALLAVLAFLPLSALAGDTLQWRCWYNQQVHITCLIDEVPETAPVMGALNLPDNLPPIVARLRRDPASFRNQAVHIPLHTQPYDMAFTALLARSAVCGSRPDCAVNFTTRSPSTEELTALLTKHLAFRQDKPAMVAMIDPEDD